MSDYSFGNDFSAKDALSTGDPLKLIKGSDLDAEFEAVATASATKIDEPGAPTSGDLLSWNGSAWVAIAAPAALPAGIVSPYGAATAPSGWVLCDGAAYNSVTDTTFADLFAVIGTTYGGTGASNFLVPDLKGRVPAGKEVTGTRLTSGTSGIDGGTLGAAGGNQNLTTHAHTAGTLVNSTAGDHTHVFTVYSSDAGSIIGAQALTDGNTTTFTAQGIANAGNHTHTISGSTANDGTGSSQNVQPTIVLQYIIKK